ncbi:ATP-binding protein [Salinarimonas rosea]|uniref:ATP-binding protein n=1 Tax=Salinarimonas rosea TaxID=552063 RepID=UPI00040FF56D|nr:ATP-binding protein [Salinarimonas rosea]
MTDAARPPIAYAMCGLAFSGKSTIARTIAQALKIDIVSLDAINDERGFDGGNVVDDSEWERTSHIAMERLAGHLAAGRSAIVDDTFAFRFLRDRCAAVAARHGAGFRILMVETPLPEIEARRRANDLTGERMGLSDAVFDDHVARFQGPEPDEPVVRLAAPEDVDRFLAEARTRRA